MCERGSLIVVSGFAGAGKGTIIKKLLSERTDCVLSVSMTTRLPRSGEKDGEAYYFVSKERFKTAIKEGELIEYADYVGNYYGTPKSYIEGIICSGKNVILEIETQGALQIKNMYPESVLVFVTPPYVEELEMRLISRGSESNEIIRKRMKRVEEEAKCISNYDYLIVNDEIDKSVRVLNMIIEISRNRTVCKASFIKRLCEERCT